jgi:hypothetical protein
MNIIENTEADRFINEIKVAGINYFSLGIIKGDQIFSVFSCPQWQKFYIENQCFEFDPVVRAAYLNHDLPVDWSSVTVSKKKEAFIMQARRELTGCQEGFSILKKINNKDHAIIAFGAEKSFSTLLEVYATYQSQISTLIDVLNRTSSASKK